MHLILLDSEITYVRELLKQISLTWPDLDLLGICQAEQLISQLPLLADQHVLVLYNPLEQPDMPDWKNKNTPSHPLAKWVYLPLFPDGQAAGNQPADRLYRLDSTENLFRYINVWLSSIKATDQTSSLDSKCIFEHSDPALGSEICQVPSIAQDEPQIWFILRLNPELSDQPVRKLLESALKKGLKTIYLPLMPTYQMRLANFANQGPTLSDLILLLTGNAVEDGDAGHYLQPSPRGWLQFRPPARSDDLISCDPSALRQLLQFVRRSISMNPAFVLVDCQGTALSSALAAAAIADVCQIHLPDSAGFAQQAARRELNRFVNQLPNSCQVMLKEPGTKTLSSDNLPEGPEGAK